jgi:8-oxo-dGTP pyrophosphatase MutT (NUDIX family)
MLFYMERALGKKIGRVTLFVDFDDHFVIVKDPTNGFWFLPGGGLEHGESVEEAAKREASEELGLGVRINQTIKTFHVTLISKETRERLKIPPFIVVHATYIEGQLKTQYAHNRKILLVKKDDFKSLFEDFVIPEEYEWMKPYFYISQEAIREFLSGKGNFAIFQVS